MEQAYDYVILGGGMDGLSMGALLAHEGYSVCLVEGYSDLGGYAHTLKAGPYSFCHEVQYIMGCEEGGPINTLLKKIGLEHDVQFNALDGQCFDLVNINGKRVGIPHGWENYERELVGLYPAYADCLRRYFSVFRHLFNEGDGYHKVISKWDILLHPIKHRTLLRYRNYTLQDFFDQLQFPVELQAILAGQDGNLSNGPHEASLLMHAAMQVAYCTSAYFPKKGMEYFVNAVADRIRKSPGCRVMTDCTVEHIFCAHGEVSAVKTTRGTIYGRQFISNIDPQRTMQLLTGASIPSWYERKMHYPYSNSVFTVYLGLKDVDLRKHGFGRMNIWHHSRTNIEAEYRDEVERDDFSRPWVFISTPSMCTDEGYMAPEGHHTMEILTFVNYDHFKRRSSEDPVAFKLFKEKIAEKLLDIVEKNYLPDIRQYIEVKIVHTPLDVERMLHSPKGNVYGCNLTPCYFNLNRITAETPFSNLHLVGATAAYPGIMGVILGSLTLFQKLVPQSAAQKAHLHADHFFHQLEPALS